MAERRGPSREFIATLCAVYAVAAAVILPLDWNAPPPDDGRPVPMGIYSRPLVPPAPDSAALEREAVALFAHAPFARVFERRTHEPETSARIAKALVAEARRISVAPSLLAAVLLTENHHLDPDTVSSRGATGLMQVMPFHAGEYGCPSSDLTDVETNICHGARILGGYLRRTGTVSSALLRYNGCPVGAVASSCTHYPDQVLAAAGRVRREVLQYAARETRRRGTPTAP
jgi:soluble lytic murein transglycosylase-like protein